MVDRLEGRTGNNELRRYQPPPPFFALLLWGSHDCSFPPWGLSQPDFCLSHFHTLALSRVTWELINPTDSSSAQAGHGCS